MQDIQCCMLANDGNLHKRDQIKHFSQLISSRVWKTALVRQLFQTAWFQLFQVASLVVVTTGINEVKIQVLFWSQHSLRSNLRALTKKKKTIFWEEHAPRPP